MNKYVRVMRPDHWIKQLFIMPGCVFALLLAGSGLRLPVFAARLVLALAATCLVASANYVINEWLDAEFDRFHPTKKFRSVVTEDVRGVVIWTMWAVLLAAGIALARAVGVPFALAAAVLWAMGILYNVRPFRTKDVPVLDVLSESLNNAIRLLLGWFVVSPHTLPPVSIVLGYWMGGAFLMAVKRYAEFRMIGDPALAGRYRRSFRFYTERSLLVSAFFYAMCSTFFTGIFLVKYRIELVLFVPALMGLFCYYLHIAFKEDSAVQKPEKLYRERLLMAYCAALAVLFVVLMAADLPWLSALSDDALISF